MDPLLLERLGIVALCSFGAFRTTGSLSFGATKKSGPPPSKVTSKIGPSNWLADIARGSDCIGGWFNLSDLHGERPDVVLPS